MEAPSLDAACCDMLRLRRPAEAAAAAAAPAVEAVRAVVVATWVHSAPARPKRRGLVV